MIRSHNVESILFTENDLVLKVDGQEHIIKLNVVSEKLAGASAIERGMYKLSPSGYGIHWPLLDEDLSVSSLIASALNN